MCVCVCVCVCARVRVCVVCVLQRSSVSMYVSLLPHVLQDGLAQVTEGVFHSSSLLRHTVLTGLSSLPKSELPTDPQLLAGLYIARHEEDEANCSLATR